MFSYILFGEGRGGVAYTTSHMGELLFYEHLQKPLLPF